MGADKRSAFMSGNPSYRLESEDSRLNHGDTAAFGSRVLPRRESALEWRLPDNG